MFEAFWPQLKDTAGEEVDGEAILQVDGEAVAQEEEEAVGK